MAAAAWGGSDVVARRVCAGNGIPQGMRHRGSFTILRFAEPRLADVVYLEQLTSALYLRKREDTGHYLQVMDRMSAQAEPAERTPWCLQQIIKTI